MFKFNFGNDDESSDTGEKKEVIKWYACQKVEIAPDIRDSFNSISGDGNIILKYQGNLTITCVPPARVIDQLKQKPENEMFLDAVEAEKNNSDLVPGKYEGGLKIWECTKDLVNYFMENTSGSLSGKNVLDLGCGSGILGIVSLLKGASVTFQDYNQEVLTSITIPNIFLNMKCMEVYDRTQFYSGDWASFVNVVSPITETSENEEPALKRQKTDGLRKFDFILTSETIYNPSSYEKISLVIKKLMKPDGLCYVAAKTCYFGVGGNVNGFVKKLMEENIFVVEQCWYSNEGIAREILRITFKTNGK